MAKPKLVGGCGCGAVRYEITSEPGFSFLCQCRNCQRATGTGHAPSFVVERENWSVTGNLTSYETESDSGHRVSRDFCPVCGSPVFGTTSQFPATLIVFAASLDDPSVFKPQRAIFTASAQPWDYIDPSLV